MRSSRIAAIVRRAEAQRRVPCGTRLTPALLASPPMTARSPISSSIASGKVREIYEWRGRPADGRLRPDLRLRRGHADADPRQGQGADPDVGVLVRDDRRHRPQPLHLRGRARGGRRPGDAGAAARDVPGRVRRPRLPLRLGLEGVPARPASVCGIELPGRACASPTSCPSRSSPRRPRPRSATTTRTSTSTAPPRSIGDRPLMEELRRVSIELYEHAARPRGRARDHPRRHQVRVRRLARAPRSCSATRC